jgi:hypothetical protein
MESETQSDKDLPADVKCIVLLHCSCLFVGDVQGPSSVHTNSEEVEALVKQIVFMVQLYSRDLLIVS